jgi:TonB family protein
LALAALVNVLLFSLLIYSNRPHDRLREQYLFAELVPPARAVPEPIAPPEPTQHDPKVEARSAPDFEVDPSDAELPPRPDPLRPNRQLHLAAARPEVEATGRPVIVTLRLLVRADGTIASSEVVGSSGIAQLDAIASQFAMQNWRFLPAVSAGHNVSDWISVQVLLMFD